MCNKVSRKWFQDFKVPNTSDEDKGRGMYDYVHKRTYNENRSWLSVRNIIINSKTIRRNTGGCLIQDILQSYSAAQNIQGRAAELACEAELENTRKEVVVTCFKFLFKISIQELRDITKELIRCHRMF
jgi:hypothetical protein